jgi:hypothetical protein
MPLVDEIIPFLRSRSFKEGWGLVRRAFAPTETVLEHIGPSAGRMGFGMRNVEDDMERAVGSYFPDDFLPIHKWEAMDPAKRLAAGRLRNGWAYPTDAPLFADPEVQAMDQEIKRVYSRADERIRATVDPTTGKGVQVRDPITGEWRDYEPVSDNYLTRFIKVDKRNAILDPIQYTQAELERSLAKTVREKNNMGAETLLDLDMEKQVKTDAENAIDEYLRSGKENAVLNDPALLNTMAPAHQGFQELAAHFRKLAIAQAEKTGSPIPEEVDPITQLFGTTTPEGTKGGMKLLREFFLRDAQNARRMGSIESSRAVPLPRDWYEEDPLRIVPIYLMRLERRLAEIKHFGQDSEVVLDKDTGLLSRIANDTDRDYAKRTFERFMGTEPYNKSLKAQKWTDLLFATQALKLGTAQVSQLGQIMNVIMETNLGPTWKALGNLGMSKDVALRSGAALTRIVDVARESSVGPSAETGARKFTEDFLKYTGMTKADLYTRHIGAGAGWVHGEEMLHRLVKNANDPVALRELRRLIPGATKNEVTWQKFLQRVQSVRDATGGVVSPSDISTHFAPDLTDIARTVSLNANFRNSILDLPLWASTPTGKMISMFRTFAYKQTRFVAKRVMDDLSHGNPRPLIGLAVGAGVLGPVISGLKSIPRGGFGEEMDENKKAVTGDAKALAYKGLENLATVGAFGLFDQFARFMRGDSRELFQFLAGPLFTDVINLGNSGFEFAGGVTGIGKPEQTAKGLRDFGQFAGSHVPIIGGGVTKALRTGLEPVTRDPSGRVFREDSRQLIGTEAPPIEIGPVSLPSLPVLLGMETSAYRKRGDLMDQLKEAITSGDRKGMQKILQQAQAAGIRISPASINRLMKEHIESQAAA